MRHYILDNDDIEHIRTRRHAHNKLGFALQLCAFRYPGRLLTAGEIIPLPVTEFLTAQIGVKPHELAGYAETNVTRRRHLVDLRSIYGYKMFSGRGAHDLKTWLEGEAETARSNEDLVKRFIGECRRTHTILYHRAECLTHVGDSQAVRSLTQCGEPMRFAMAAPIDLRNDFDSVSLRRLAKRTRDATQSRRLLALAEVYDGSSRTDASRIGGVGLQIIRDWVLRFNARGPDGLVDGKSPGAPSKLNADHRRALAEVVEAGPVPAVDGVVRWRRKDLARWLLETFAISLDETTVGRELKALGFAKISARPRHYAQNELAVEAFKKNFPAELAKIRARLPKGVEIELWWQDESRIGQKNKLTRRWARRGTRPRAPRDQRTEWAYIFGAICPAKGKGAGLIDDQCRRRSRRPCGADRRSGRLALDAQAGDPRQHHRPGAAATIARVEPGGECLAIHARQLVVEPDLQILRRHRRAVLPSLEQPHRPTMEDHVPRHAQMGAWVLINDRWYYRGYRL